MVKGIVSVVENQEDPYHLPCIEFLKDICKFFEINFSVLKNPKVVARANGVKPLVNILLESKYVQYHDGIINTILYLLDDKETRKYFRLEYDLQPLISSFTQLSSKDSKLPLLWESSGRIISKMMRTWSGFIVLNHDGLAMKVLTESLMIQDTTERVDKILDTITNILWNASPEEYKYIIPKISNKDSMELELQLDKSYHINRRYSTPVGVKTRTTKESSSTEASVTQTFFACTILSLVHSGLVEVLHDLSEKGEYPRAAKLFQVLLALSDKLLPSDLCLRMHDDFDSEYSSEMNQLYSSGNQKKTKKTLSMLTTFYHHSKSLFKQRTSHYLKVENVKTKIDTSMDDTQYQNFINQSNVLKDKNFRNWDWNSISALVYGPLRAPLRVSEMINNKATSKFCKRVLGYFKPFKRAFSELSIQDGMFFTDLCCQLLENLLSSPEGIEVIKGSKFIQQLKDIIEIETLPNPDIKKERVLSETSFTLKLSREYFRIMGKLSSITHGVSLLEENKVFSAMESMIKSGKRDEIVQAIIQNLDFSLSNSDLNQYSRSILKTAMNSSKKNIRNSVIVRVKQLMKENKKIDFQRLGIELLYGYIEIFEKDDLSAVTLQILEAVCRSPENLDILISLKPDVYLFEKRIEGRDLLLRMLSRESGYYYLLEKKWIERNLEDWKEKNNLEYSINIESSLKKAMNEKRNRQIDLDPNKSAEYIVVLSPHFYGEICKTKAGCEYIQKTGHLTEFLELLESPNTDKTLKRAIFWALGHMGSSDTGYEFIDGDKFIEKLISYCEKSHCLSLRGLCMYIVSEMSKSTKARKKLEKLGWDSVVDQDSSSIISLPRDPTLFLSVPEYEYEGSYTDFSDEYTIDEKDLPIIEGDFENNILFQLSRLANTLTEEKAFLEIKKLRTQTNLPKFNSKEMICRIFYMLDKYKFSKKSRNGVFYPLLDINALDIPMPFDYLDENYNKK